MNRKRAIKKPPTGRTGSGESENLQGSGFFYSNCTQSPQECKVNFDWLSDAWRVQAEIYELQAKAGMHFARAYDNLAQAKLLMQALCGGGTVTP